MSIPPIFFDIPIHLKEVDILIKLVCDEIKVAEELNNFDMLQFLNNMLYNLKDFTTNQLKIHVYELDYLTSFLLTSYIIARDNDNNIIATNLLNILQRLLPLNQTHISFTNYFWRQYDSKEKRAKTLYNVWLLATDKKSGQHR